MYSGKVWTLTTTGVMIQSSKQKAGIYQCQAVLLIPRIQRTNKAGTLAGIRADNLGQGGRGTRLEQTRGRQGDTGGTHMVITNNRKRKWT